MDNEVKSNPAGDENPILPLQEQAQPSETAPSKPKRKINFLKVFIFGFVIIITILSFSLIAYLIIGNQTKQKAITTYEECAAAGFPIMESYPEQCAASGQTFTRILTAEEQKKLDPTAGWETYEGDGFIFKYPKDWQIKKYTDVVTLYPPEVDINGSSISLMNAPEISIITNLNKAIDKYEQSNKTEQGTEFITGWKKVAIDNVGGIYYETHQCAPQCSSDVIVPYKNNGSLIISLSSTAKEKGYTQIYDQILSTFKFTGQSADIDTSTWKTYVDPNEKIGFKYPQDWELNTQVVGNNRYASISKKDSKGNGSFNIHLSIGNILQEGVPGDSYKKNDDITLAGKQIYLLKGTFFYTLSTCDLPTKYACLLETQSGKDKIEFFASYYVPGEGGPSPFPENDPLTEVIHSIFKTVYYSNSRSN